jgi:pimeloyl-ACP methyl ester carboxylesterase
MCPQARLSYHCQQETNPVRTNQAIASVSRDTAEQRITDGPVQSFSADLTQGGAQSFSEYQRPQRKRASMNWELYESGPDDADHTVLLLPGGLCSARSFAEVMAEPALNDVRLVAATLPGHCGTEPPDDISSEGYARLAADLAEERGCDVVVGYSMGATVAAEMVASGLFAGPVVLLGVSMSTKDEPAFFRAIVRSGSVLGGLPSAALGRMAAMMLKPAPLSPERKAELTGDFRRNQPRVIRRLLREYLRYLGRHNQPATRLCEAGVATWVVHADKGDGGLTDEERRTLETCPHANLITIPGQSYLLPNEKSEEIADIIVTAIAAV